MAKLEIIINICVQRANLLLIISGIFISTFFPYYCAISCYCIVHVLIFLCTQLLRGSAVIIFRRF